MGSSGEKPVAVFGGGSQSPGDGDWELAYSVGKLLARMGFVTVTGGYGGAMEAVSRGALENGGRTFAFLHSQPEERPPNPFVSDFHVAADYQERLACLLRVPAAIALPGGGGTLAEVMASLALLSRHPGRKLAIYGRFWEPILTMLIQQVSGLRREIDEVFGFRDVVELENWLHSVNGTKNLRESAG